MQQTLTMLQEMEGKTVSWKTVHGIKSGVIVAKVTRDNLPLGYLVKLGNAKYVIVNSKSFIHVYQATKQEPR